MRNKTLARGIATLTVLGAALTASPAIAASASPADVSAGTPAGGGSPAELEVSLHILQLIPEGTVSTTVRVNGPRWDRQDVFSRYGGPTFEPHRTSGPLKDHHADRLRGQLPRVVGDAQGETPTCAVGETITTYTLTVDDNDFVARACQGEQPRSRAFSDVVDVLTQASTID